MQRQGSFAAAEYGAKKKQTRRDRFLAEMEAVVPWPRLVARLLLRVRFLQQWYAMADPAMEDALEACPRA